MRALSPAVLTFPARSLPFMRRPVGSARMHSGQRNKDFGPVSSFVSHPVEFVLQQVLFLQWYFKALPVERRTEGATKVARVFPAIIFDQLGQMEADLGS